MPGVRQKVHDLVRKIMGYLMCKLSGVQMILPMMKLTGWSILLVSAAARLRSTVHDVSAISLMPIVHEVKRTLKFDDQADASDASMPPADETEGSGFVDSASDAADDAATDWDTFWTRKPTRDMIRTLSSQEVESNKTDLAVARLDEWMLKFMAFTRRRFPQFGELLEIVWTLGDLEEATSLVTTSVLANDANLWGASALMSVIDVSKPAGKVFETAMLEASQRAVARSSLCTRGQSLPRSACPRRRRPSLARTTRRISPSATALPRPDGPSTPCAGGLRSGRASPAASAASSRSTRTPCRSIS